MNRFPLPESALAALDKTPINDTRKFVFDAPTWRGTGRAAWKFPSAWHGTSTDFVSVSRKISKRSAKRDKLALKAQRQDGIDPRSAPEYGMRNAGLRHDTWQTRY